VGAPDAGVLEIDRIGRVEGGRGEPVDDDWGDVEAVIRLDDRFGPEALAGLAQRGKDRPNRLGVSRCQLYGVEGRVLRVRGLDAVDGTPVLDIKPWMAEFGPRGETRQPAWASELMRSYW
jgi:tRNA (adenine37-N6)-methyltransferase